MRGRNDNVRLESMLIVLESGCKDLDRATRRFREANDALERGLRRPPPPALDKPHGNA